MRPLLVVALALLLPASLLQAADFTGRIKRVRIKRRRTSSSYTVSAQTSGDEDSDKAISSLEIKFEEPFEGPVPQENPVSLTRDGNVVYELVIPNAGSDVVSGEDYKVKMALLNADGKQAGDAVVLEGAYDFAAGDVAEEPGVQIGQVVSTTARLRRVLQDSFFDVFYDLRSVYMTAKDDSDCSSCIVVQLAHVEGADDTTPAPTTIAVSMESATRAFEAKSESVEYVQDWAATTDFDDDAVGSHFKVVGSMHDDAGATLAETASFDVEVEDDDSSDDSVQYRSHPLAKKRIRQNAVRRLRTSLTIIVQDDDDDFEYSIDAIDVVVDDTDGPLPEHNPIPFTDVIEGYEYVAKNEGDDVDPGTLYELSLTPLDENGNAIGDEVTIEGAYDLDAGCPAFLTDATITASFEVDDGRRRLQTVSAVVTVTYATTFVSMLPADDEECPRCIAIELSEGRTEAGDTDNVPMPAKIRVTGESTDGTKKVSGVSSSSSRIRMFSPPDGVDLDGDVFGGETYKLTATMTNKDGKEVGSSFSWDVVVENLEDEDETMKVVGDVDGDLAVNAGDLVLLNGEVGGDIVITGGTLKLDGSSCKGDLLVSGGDIEFGNHHQEGSLIADGPLSTWHLATAAYTSFSGGFLSKFEEGTVDLGGNFSFAGDATLSAKSASFSSTLDVGGSSLFVVDGGNIEFQDSSILTSGSSSMVINGGSLIARDSARLTVGGSSSDVSGGNFNLNVGGGGDILFSGSATMTVSGGSLLTVTGGNFNAQNQASFNLEGDSALTIEGGSFELHDDAAFHVAGDSSVLVDGYDVILSNSSAFTGGGNSLFVVDGGNIEFHDSSSVTFGSSSMVIDGGSLIARDSTRLTVGGSSSDVSGGNFNLNVGGGDILFSGSSTVTISGGSLLTVTGGNFNAQNQASFNLEGESALTIEDGSFELNDDAEFQVGGNSSFLVDGSNVIFSKSSVYTVGGSSSMTIEGGNVTVADSSTFKVGDDSTVDIVCGNFRTHESSALKVSGTSTIDITSDKNCPSNCTSNGVCT